MSLMIKSSDKHLSACPQFRFCVRPCHLGEMMLRVSGIILNPTCRYCRYHMISLCHVEILPLFEKCIPAVCAEQCSNGLFLADATGCEFKNWDVGGQCFFLFAYGPCPFYCWMTHRLVSCAILRWTHPALGSISLGRESKTGPPVRKVQYWPDLISIAIMPRA